MSVPFVCTYSDAIGRLSAFLRSRPKAPSSDMETIRASIEESLREIAVAHDWNCMRRIWRIPLQAACSTGTVTYAASGDNYSYELTLSGDTWPTWAADGEIKIGEDNVLCEVDERKSATVLTLKYPRVPQEDITTGVSYTIGRSWYELPPEFMGNWSALERNAWFIGKHVKLDDWHTLTKYRNWTGAVRYWSIGPAPNRYGTMALFVYPWSANTQECDLLVNWRPRPLSVSGRDLWNYDGTVSVAEDDTAVTGSNTDFRSSMQGSIIRFANDSSALPTGTNGTNPYLFQQSIASVTDSTNLKLSSASSVALDDVKYTISDPIDLDIALFDAFMRCCEKNLAHAVGMKDMANIERRYYLALQSAKSADSRDRGSRIVGRGRHFLTRLKDATSRETVE